LIAISLSPITFRDGPIEEISRLLFCPKDKKRERRKYTEKFFTAENAKNAEENAN